MQSVQFLYKTKQKNETEIASLIVFLLFLQFFPLIQYFIYTPVCFLLIGWWSLPEGGGDLSFFFYKPTLVSSGVWILSHRNRKLVTPPPFLVFSQECLFIVQFSKQTERENNKNEEWMDQSLWKRRNLENPKWSPVCLCSSLVISLEGGRSPWRLSMCVREEGRVWGSWSPL